MNDLWEMACWAWVIVCGICGVGMLLVSAWARWTTRHDEKPQDDLFTLRGPR